MTLPFDLWPPKSKQVILESKWTFVPNLKKFPQGVLEISHSQNRRTSPSGPLFKIWGIYLRAFPRYYVLKHGPDKRDVTLTLTFDCQNLITSSLSHSKHSKVWRKSLKAFLRYCVREIRTYLWTDEQTTRKHNASGPGYRRRRGIKTEISHFIWIRWQLSNSIH